MIDISEGNTNNYLVHGVFGIIFSIISIVLSFTLSPYLFLLAVVVFTFSIFLFTAKNGLQIDANNEKYRKYGKIGPLRFGTWKSYDKPVLVKLTIHNSSIHRENLPMPGKVAVVNSKALTFDLLFIDTKERSIRVYDFLKYKTAKQALAAIQKEMDVDILDLIAEKLKENKRKRGR